MAEIDFYTDFATSGRILQAGLDSSLDEWIQTLGTNYVDNTRKRVKLLDFGLIELSFWLTNKVWSCTSSKIQIQRLRHNARYDIVPQVIRDRYGDFSLSTLFSEMTERLKLNSCEIFLINDPNKSDYERYYIPKSQVIATTIPLTSTASDVRPGSIWSLGLSDQNADIWSKPHTH